MAEKLAELFAVISADTRRWKPPLQEAQKDLSAFGAKTSGTLDEIRRAFLKLAPTVSFASIGAFTLNAAKKFEEANAIIQRATGATGGRLDQLNESFEAIYRTSGKSSDVIATALAKLSIESGASGTALENLVGINLKFAKVTSTDVTQSVEKTQDVFKRWQIGTEQQAAALETLYTVMKNTSMPMGELISAVMEAGPVMQTLGFTFEQTAGFIGQLHEAGIPASSVISTLSRVLAKLAKDTGDPVKALEVLLDRIRSAKDDAEALHIVMGKGGRGGAGMIMFVDAVRRGTLSLEELQTILTPTGGKIEDIAKQTGTWAEKWNKLTHNTELFVQTPGKKLLDWAGALAESMTNAIIWVDRFGESLDRLSEKEQGAGTNTYDRIFRAALLASGMAMGMPTPGKTSSLGKPKAPSVPTGWDRTSGAGDDEEYLKRLKTAWANLGLSDVRTKANDVKAAFDLLRSAGVLSAGQIQAGYRLVKQALAEVAAAGKTTQDAFGSVKIALNVPDIRDFERTWQSISGIIDAASNTANAQGNIEQFTYGWSRSMFEAYDATLQADKGLKLLGLDIARLNAGLHFEEAIDGFRKLNIQSTAELRQLRDEAQQAYDAIMTSDDSSASDRLQAQARLNAATLELLRNLRYGQTGEAAKRTDAEIKALERWEQENRKTLDRITSGHRRASQAIKNVWVDFGRQVYSIISGTLADALANAIWPTDKNVKQKDVAAITELGIRAGVTGKQLDDLVSVVENLADATGINFSTAASGAADVFQAFGVTVADQIPTLRMLYAVAKSTGIGMDDLLSGLTRGATVFKLLGLNADQAAALLGNLSRSGDDADMIVQSISSAMDSLSSQGWADPKRALLEIIERIKNAGTVSEATAIAVKYFGSNGQEMARIIRAGKLEVSALAVATDNAAESMEQAAEKARELNEEGNKGRSIWQEMGRALVRAFAEASIRGIVEFIRQMKILEAAAAGLKAIFTAIGKVLSNVFGGGSSQVSLFAGAMNAVGGGGGVSSGVGSAAGGVGSAVSGSIVGTVLSGITAGAGVANVVEGVRMEGTLNAIEHETRYTQLHTLAILEKINEFLPKTKDIHDYFVSVQYPLLGRIESSLSSLSASILRVVTANSSSIPTLAVAGVPETARVISAGGENITVNIDGLAISPGADDAIDLFREGARQLRARGVRHSVGLR